MKFLQFFSIAILLVSVHSCSNDFDLIDEGDSIPVIYGVISAQDTAIYIRVEKSFASEDISGIDLALDPNNLYFDDIQVVLKHDGSGKEVEMYRVDGNFEGLKRDTGFFASAPNYLYKLKRNEINLIEGDNYTLIVRKNDGQEICQSKTPILRAMREQDNDVPTPPATGLLSFKYSAPFKVDFFPDPNSAIHDIILTINYREFKNGVETQKSVDWPLGVNVSSKIGGSGLGYTKSVLGRSFYQFLGAAIPAVDPSEQITRVIKDASLKIISGGQPIKDYITIGQINLGITSSGELPVYSNISNNGRGLFSSKSTFIRLGIPFNSETRDSIRKGIYTKQLNFQ